MVAGNGEPLGNDERGIVDKCLEEIYKEYFKSQEDTEYYLKNRSLFKNYYKIKKS